MKNVLKVLGIIALVAVIGFSMVSCGGDDEEEGSLKWPETLAKYDGNGEAYGAWKQDTTILCFLAKKDEEGNLITGIKIATNDNIAYLDQLRWAFYLDESIKDKTFTGHYVYYFDSDHMVSQNRKCTVNYVFDTNGKLSITSNGGWERLYTGDYTKEGEW